MDLTEGARRLLAYWGPIQQAVSLRASTAELWQAVRDDAARRGLELRGVSAADMSTLRGIAAGQRTVMENFARGRPDDVIVASMIGGDVSARSPQDQLLAPRWIVRFEQDMTVNGQLATVWRASVIDGILPTRKSELRAQLEADAEQMLENSSGGIDSTTATHLGVGRIQISAV